ncbi:MAG: tetratricopeptide repeat protein, partial [Spirochaetaceae bacterium]|nr:tetratricopeptide repeat protein [Spirochaetaceae bacterium]
IRADLPDNARILLDRASEFHPGHPGLMASRGAIMSRTDSTESMRLYLDAASTVDSGSPEYIDWLLNASDMAAVSGRPDETESIIRSGLDHHPGNPALVKSLAEKLALEDRKSEASALYRNALSRSPDDRDLLEDAAWFSRSIGMQDLAETLLRDAIGRNPEDGRIWNQLGVHFMEIGWDEQSDSMKPAALEEAVKAYRRAVDIVPESLIFLGNLGDALRQSGKWTEAGEFLEKAVEGGSDTGEDAFAVNSLARLEDERSYASEGSDSSAGDWENSGHHYRQAAEIGDRNADFQRDYAWWLYRERRLEDSINFYRRAAVIDPSDDSLPYGESVCWLEFGDEKAALEALEQALKIKPSDPLLLADKADILGAAGQVDDAERLYRDVILKSEEAAWAWERLAEFRDSRAEEAEPPFEAPVLSLDGPECFDADSLITGSRSPAGDRWHRLALKAWDKALKTDPDNPKFKARCGAALMAVGRRDKSRDLLRQVPGNADSLNRLGRLELTDALKTDDRNLWNSSKIHLTSAVESAPLEASYHADLGYWHYLMNNREKALEAFRQAADRAPENPEYAANTGICAYASGFFDEGAAYLRRALAMRDREAEWQNALGLCLMASGYSNQALEAFRSACLSDPQSDVFPANLAMAHESLHAPEGPLQ